MIGLDYYAETKQNLQELAAMYDANYKKLDREIRDDIMDAKIYLEPDMLDEYMEAYKKIVDPDIKYDLLFAMTLVKDEEKLAQMGEMLSKTDVVKPQDQLYLFIYLYRNPRAKAMTWKWLTENWDYVKKMMGDKSLDSYPRYTANVIRTDDDYAAWKKFFLPMADDPALARAIKIGEKEIEARLKLIAADRRAVYDIIKA